MSKLPPKGTVERALYNLKKLEERKKRAKLHREKLRKEGWLGKW